VVFEQGVVVFDRVLVVFSFILVVFVLGVVEKRYNKHLY